MPPPLAWGTGFPLGNRFHKVGLCGQHTSTEAATCCEDDLSTAPVDGISMQGHIMNIKAHATHVLLTKNILLSGPVEGSHHTVLGLIQVSHTLGGVSDSVGAGTTRLKEPADLASVSNIPLVLLRQAARTHLELPAGRHFTLVDVPQTGHQGRALPSRTAGCACWGIWAETAYLTPHLLSPSMRRQGQIS